jgi:hypothetical protein
LAGRRLNAWQGLEKPRLATFPMAIAFNTLHESWLLSLIFSPFGRDKREGAGCENPFSTAG